MKRSNSIAMRFSILLLLAGFPGCLLFPACQKNTVVAARQVTPADSSADDEGLPPEGAADNQIQQPPAVLPTCVRYVDVDSSTALKDGLTWATAFAFVQQGIDDAAQALQPCEVWVAEGVYLIPGTSKEDTLQLRPGVSVYGGFSGTEIYQREREPSSRITVLDGSNRLFHVVTGSDDSELNGFHITQGKADGLLDNRGYGGGMLNLDCSPRVVNCVFRENQAFKNGAGMWNRNGSPRISGCTFRNNQTNDYGGGMANQGASPAVSGCIFEANGVEEMGGGIYFQGGNPLISNTLFIKNRATHGGGGLAGRASAVMTVVNCTFTGNQAGLLPISPEPGAINLDTTSTCSIVNSIIWADKQPELDLLHGTYNITYTTIVGGLLGPGNLPADPQLDEQAGYRLRAGSPCIDAGDATQAPAADKDDKPRVDDPATANTGAGNPPFVDMGAYEFNP